jgi:DnaK suppressor protein
VAASKDFLESALKRLTEEDRAVKEELADLGFGTDGQVDVNFDEGFADAAQTTSERAKILSLAEGLRQRLDDLHAALQRVERGTYGTCESCGQPIGPERLEAIPTARLCISCKQRIRKPG